ncbi:MAG TPA: neutral zinc metallopeptidase [Vicinamibacterales bacterium]|nr:neutral zinc metallopeptidase [Vicinamibacterales bacterium]
MRWTSGDGSNVEDARGRSGIGFGGGVPLGLGGFVVLLLLSWATGTNLFQVLGTGDATPAESTRAVGTAGQDDQSVAFVDAVMKDVQDTWEQLLPGRYRRTRVVLFTDSLESGCGLAQSATGPFYCPSDSRVYLDLGFFRELQDKLGAPGDFARAYVIAHEVGHHVQHLMDIEGPSVAIELQADCFAGVWGHAASQPGRASQGKVELDPGDAEEGLNAASAIGDDRLQRMATGHVSPDKFTHGSSAQRVSWFRRGLESGRPTACDTMSSTDR